VARKGGERKMLSVRLISAQSIGQQTTAQGNGNPDEADKSGETPAGTSIKSLGITVTPLTTALAGELSLPASVHGLVVQNVDPEGAAAEDLVGANNSDTPDVIVSVEGTAVRSEADLRSALRRAGPGGIVTLIVYNSQGGQRVERVKLQ